MSLEADEATMAGEVFEVHDGVVEIKQALERGAVNGDDPTCYTLQWYKSLQTWKRRIDELAEGGAIL